MAPKRSSSATAWGSPSDGSDAEGDAGRRRRHHDDPPSDAEGDKTPPPNPNPKSSSAAAAPSSTPSVAADSAAAGSDSGGTYDSDADAHRRPALRAASPKPGAKPRPRSPGINSDSYDSDDSDADARRLPAPKPASPKPGAKPRARSPGINEDSDDSAAPAASDADLDPAAGADSEDDDLSPLRPARHPRAEASIIKPISSRPMDSPPRGGGASASEPRVKRPRSAAIAAPSPDQQRRPSRLWSHDDELLILRGLATYRAKSGVLPGSTNDIGKLHSHIRSQLSVRVSTTQLSDKVRRLKQKYQVLATRAKNGREQDLHTPHDRSIFEHAKKVWGVLVGSGSADGGGSGYENAAAGDSDEMQYSGDSDYDMESGRDDRYHIKNRKLRPITAANGNGIGLGAVNISANGRGKSEFEKGKDAYPYLWETVEELSREHPSGAAFKKAFEVLEGSKARAIEEKLRKFRLTEIRQQLRRMDLMKDTVRMVLDALENAD